MTRRLVGAVTVISLATILACEKEPEQVQEHQPSQATQSVQYASTPFYQDSVFMVLPVTSAAKGSWAGYTHGIAHGFDDDAERCQIFKEATDKHIINTPAYALASLSGMLQIRLSYFGDCCKLAYFDATTDKGFRVRGNNAMDPKILSREEILEETIFYSPERHAIMISKWMLNGQRTSDLEGYLDRFFEEPAVNQRIYEVLEEARQ